MSIYSILLHHFFNDICCSKQSSQKETFRSKNLVNLETTFFAIFRAASKKQTLSFAKNVVSLETKSKMVSNLANKSTAVSDKKKTIKSSSRYSEQKLKKFVPKNL